MTNPSRVRVAHASFTLKDRLAHFSSDASNWYTDVDSFGRYESIVWETFR